MKKGILAVAAVAFSAAFGIVIAVVHNRNTKLGTGSVNTMSR